MGRKGGGAAGGKDSLQLPPVDQYRKRIGKQDTNKAKVHLKQAKHVQQVKEHWSAAYKDSFLIMLTVSAIFLGVYGLLYFAIT